MWRRAVSWTTAAALAVPLGALLHELAHYLSALIFGFQGVTLHYSYTTYGLMRTVDSHIYAGDLPRAAAIYPLQPVLIALLPLLGIVDVGFL